MELSIYILDVYGSSLIYGTDWWQNLLIGTWATKKIQTIPTVDDKTNKLIGVAIPFDP